MKGRVAIPIQNEHGQFVAYAGRWASHNVPEGVKRYTFTPGFQSRHMLFNLNRARPAKHVVLVESFWSVFRLWPIVRSMSFGRPEPVALMGRSLSDQQIALLEHSGITHVTLMLNGDQSGRVAATEILPRLARSFFSRLVKLPNGTKPHSAPETIIRTLLVER